jgi:hypothetical protein
MQNLNKVAHNEELQHGVAAVRANRQPLRAGSRLSEALYCNDKGSAFHWSLREWCVK